MQSPFFPGCDFFFHLLHLRFAARPPFAPPRAHSGAPLLKAKTKLKLDPEPKDCKKKKNGGKPSGD